jgi:DNA-3-methyladenine glycosylase II
MTTFDARVAEALHHLAATDPVMRGVVAAVGPCRLSPAWHQSPFESLVRAVAYQQLQKKAAEAVLGRFLALFAPRPFPSPAEILAVDETALRAAGFSRNKILAIRDIAAKAEAGIVPTRDEADALSDAELIGQLVVIRGVGQWTAEMLLIFALGRLDVLPLDDFGVRKGTKIAFGLDAMPSKQEMLGLTDCWRPYRSVASWYMWRLVERAARAGAQRPEPPGGAEPGPELSELERHERAGGGEAAPARSPSRR